MNNDDIEEFVDAPTEFPPIKKLIPFTYESIDVEQINSKRSLSTCFKNGVSYIIYSCIKYSLELLVTFLTKTLNFNPKFDLNQVGKDFSNFGIVFSANALKDKKDIIQTAILEIL